MDIDASIWRAPADIYDLPANCKGLTTRTDELGHHEPRADTGHLGWELLGSLRISSQGTAAQVLTLGKNLPEHGSLIS